jgi:ornithine cyclodeaminase
MLVLSAKDMSGLVSRKEAVDAMEEAFRIQESGSFRMPDRMHVDFAENTLLLMPAFMDSVFSTKLVSLFPRNKEKGLPPLNGTVLLNDGKNGVPLALLNGAWVTALRTGAVGGTAMRHLVGKKEVRAGIIGAGTQGIQQALFACSEMNVNKMVVYDPDPQRIEIFTTQLEQALPGSGLIHAENPEEVIRECDVVVTASNSEDPLFSCQGQEMGPTTFIAIGSYKPHMQELPDEIYHQAVQVFIDTPLAMQESGDLVRPIENGVLNDSRIFLLGELITGRVQIEDQPVKVFKSVGMALFDLVMAHLLYERALEKGSGLRIEM